MRPLPLIQAADSSRRGRPCRLRRRALPGAIDVPAQIASNAEGITDSRDTDGTRRAMLGSALASPRGPLNDESQPQDRADYLLDGANSIVCRLAGTTRCRSAARPIVRNEAPASTQSPPAIQNAAR
jgi:hypothetical protein